MSRTLLVACALFAAGSLVDPLPAQGVARVVPEPWTTVEGPSNSYFPYVYDKTRVQHLIQANRFCASSSILFGFAYRIDGGYTTALAASTIPNTTVTVGYTTADAATMSKTFASNRKGTQTQVFQGNYNLPAQPVPAGIGTFNIVYKWSTPFVFIRAQGNLLIEFEVPGQASQKTDYVVDAIIAGQPVATRGKPGQFGDKTSSQLVLLNPINTKPGGSLDLLNRGMSQAYPTVHVWGFSNLSWGGVPLPFDAGPFGAPGNMLENAMDLIIPATVTASGGGWDASSKLLIPNDPAFDGFHIYATNICVDLTANALGLVLGHGIGTTIGGYDSSGMQILSSSDSTSATGSFFANTGDGGPITQLTGTFQ